MSKKKFRTDFLFPSMGLLSGIGSTINIFGNYYNFNYSETVEDADFKAILNDWGVIGQDLEDTIKSNPITCIAKS